MGNTPEAYMKLADILRTDRKLTIQTTLEPYTYDLKVFLVQCYPPMFVMGVGICSLWLWALSIGEPTKISYLELFQTAATALGMISIPLIWVIARVFYGMRRQRILVFDLENDHFLINGKIFASLDKIKNVRLQTRWGCSGNRIFRLVIGFEQVIDVVVVETPWLEPNTMPISYFSDTYSERFRTSFVGWHDYKGEKGGIDPRDRQIFILADEIPAFLGNNQN